MWLEVKQVEPSSVSVPSMITVVIVLNAEILLCVGDKKNKKLFLNCILLKLTEI